MNSDLFHIAIQDITIGQVFNQLFTISCFAIITSIMLVSAIIKLQYQYRLSQYQTKAKTTFRERRRRL